MLGWILGGIAVAALFSTNNDSTDSVMLREENKSLRQYNESLYYENRYLRLTIDNHRQLLKDYDYINRFSKNLGYKGVVDFFYYLAEEHDRRFESLARFLNKVRHIRNDVAHNGAVFQLNDSFFEKLSACRLICDRYRELQSGCDGTYYRLRLM